MKSIIFLVIYFAMIPFSFAIKTKVEGKAPGAEELSIRLYIWDDFISYKETLLLESKIDKNGNFSFDLDLHGGEVLTGFFRIMNFQSSEIFLTAGNNYQLSIDSFDYKDPNRIYIPHLSTIELHYQIINSDSTEINNMVHQFNVEYNRFFVKELNLVAGVRSQIMKRLPKSKVDCFQRAMEDKFKYTDNKFLKNYMEYSFAEMHLGFRTCGIECIYNKYLYRKPFLYDNIQFMTFFSEFYKDFIFSVSTKIPGKSIMRNINKSPNLSGILDSLGRDTLLKNELIREAVLLLNMRDWYSNPYFSKENLIGLMEDYAKNTKFDFQERIAKNLVYILTEYQSGKLMPEFTFKDINGPEFNNDSLKDKPTYILFFTTWSKPCLSELQTLNKLEETWGDSIRFVGVNMDEEPLKLYYFLDDNTFNFPIYHFDNNYVLAEELSLDAFPYGMLIDENGKYILHTAYLPSEGINEYFQKMFAPPKEKEINIGN